MFQLAIVYQLVLENKYKALVIIFVLSQAIGIFRARTPSVPTLLGSTILLHFSQLAMARDDLTKRLSSSYLPQMSVPIRGSTVSSYLGH